MEPLTPEKIKSVLVAHEEEIAAREFEATHYMDEFGVVQPNPVTVL